MRVRNIHRRTIKHPKQKVSELFKTLATTNDLIWPNENWPAIRFKDGLKIGSYGGHGVIRYTIIDLKNGEHIKFQFVRPIGFNGTHQLDVMSIDDYSTEISHKINMTTIEIDN